MTEPITTDVFKFVAVRSLQKASDADTPLNFVRDVRADSNDGLSRLSIVARELTNPPRARDLLKIFDRKSEHLQAAFRELTKALGSDDTDLVTQGGVPAMLRTSVPDDTDKLQKSLDEAWDALYAAHSFGPTAGEHLEAPMAALRVLHVVALSRAGSIENKKKLELALQARPLIPRVVADVLPATSQSHSPAPAEESSPPKLDRLTQGILDEYLTTHQMLSDARNFYLQQRPEARWMELPGEARTSQSTMVTRAPTFFSAVRNSVPDMGELVLRQVGLDKSSSLSVAMNRLQGHAVKLTQRLLTQRDDPALQQHVMTLTLKPGVSDLVSAMTPISFAGFGILGPAADVDMTGRVRPLGIGDLKVVKQKLLAYQPGEVAHIENVLKGEAKERKYRDLDRTETVLFTSEETTEETERDTQTTDRFELKKEAEQTIKDDMSVQSGLTVTGGFGPVTITAHGDFAYSTSQTESLKNSSNFAREVVDRSVSKIQKKTKTEQTKTTFHETEETNTHTLDNTRGSEHISGIYRWVDKLYRAQVYNYGRRLMLEFMVPEPAAYFRASQAGLTKVNIDAEPPAPFVDLSGKPLTVDSMTPGNYLEFVSRYKADGTTPPPPEWTSQSTGFEQSQMPGGQTFSKSVKDIVTPAGYRMMYYVAQVSALWQNFPHLFLQVGDNRAYLLKDEKAMHGVQAEIGWAQDPGDWDNPNAAIPITVGGYDINAYAVNVTVNFECTDEEKTRWKLQTFEKVSAAYKALKTEYDQKVKQAQAEQAGVTIVGRNPAINLEIIKQELKKQCLTLLTGQHWNSFHAMTNPSDPPTHLPEIDVYTSLDEGRIVQFLEQAFDWEQITYLFYPYFWGRKSNWVGLSNLSDPDPLFMHFLQSGFARVVVPVSPAYNDAILYFLQSKSPVLSDKIWMGGQPPTIDDPLYVSIADELRQQTDDLAGATPEGDPWEFTVPTTLVWLQRDPDLPVFSQ